MFEVSDQSKATQEESLFGQVTDFAGHHKLLTGLVIGAGMLVGASGMGAVMKSVAAHYPEVTLVDDVGAASARLSDVPLLTAESSVSTRLLVGYDHLPVTLEGRGSMAEIAEELSTKPPSAAVMLPNWVLESTARLPLAMNAEEDLAIRTALKNPEFLSALDHDPTYLEAYGRTMQAARSLPVSAFEALAPEHETLMTAANYGQADMLLRMREMALNHMV